MILLILSGLLFVVGICLILGSILVEMIFDLHRTSMFSINMIVIGLIMICLSLFCVIGGSYLIGKEKYSPNTTHIEYIYESL